jgi:hypothetical protein
MLRDDCGRARNYACRIRLLDRRLRPIDDYRRNESIPALSKCLNEPGILCRVSESIPNLIDGTGDSVLEVDGGVVAPDLVL